MESKRFILRNEDVLANAQAFLSAVKIDDEQPMEVVVRKYKRNRSLEQNNTYWDWVDTIGKELGYPKDDMHEVLMRQFLKPHILEIDGKQIEVYSTKRLNVREMSEYMERVDQLAAEYGITLRRPEDRWAA